MAVLPIRVVGDPVLRTPAAPVTEFDAVLARLIEDMIDTMYAAPGVGLAAPQVGVGLRVFVYDVDYNPHDPGIPRLPRVVVNPTLVLDQDSGPGLASGADPGDGDDGGQRADGAGDERADGVGDDGGAEVQPGPREMAEGCLSVPRLYFPTPRAWRATVRGVDATGAPVEIDGQGLAARCFQHECDHLDGVLYLDRLTGPARVAAVRALREQPPSSPQAPGAERGASTGDDPLWALRRASR
ncbi:peptide deformylase [Frankia sp. AiPa1]|uniref:peptide deformylase n=1 Tax=Frankia sp. AiPa1 TaxID=573492 RepID=UPI00202B6D14|nr:peptide deformylase [Frankia sp. AiPa1]MCL9759695.1 peptide deformylase [Frankia sp. AiPa1]